MRNYNVEASWFVGLPLLCYEFRASKPFYDEFMPFSAPINVLHVI
jgi:hypothetical protein